MRLSLALFILLATTGQQASAIPVFDFAGYGLKLKSLYNEYKQIRMLEQRISYEKKAAERLIARLQKWKFHGVNSVDDVVLHIGSIRARSRSIGYTYKSIENEFDNFYGHKGPSNNNYKGWKKQSDDSIKDAMMAQGRLENSQKHMENLDEVVKDKRKDENQGATLQAIGEINAIQSKQLADLTEVVATDARAQQSVMMEKRAKEQAQREHEAHLMKDFNKHKKSRPMNNFPSLGGGHA